MYIYTTKNSKRLKTIGKDKILLNHQKIKTIEKKTKKKQE